MNHKYIVFAVGLLVGLIGFTAQSVQATIVVEGEITTTTWTTADSPYYLPTVASVTSGNTLTIEPGVVVKFGDAAHLVVGGSLVATGTADDPIVFTSYHDDSYAGDTNGDGNATSPTFQDWNGVVFSMQHVVPTGEFDYVIMQYGGGEASSAMLALRSGNISIANSTFQYSAYGLLDSLPAVDLIVDRSTFDVNGSSGWYAVNGSGQITNSSFSGSYQACLYASDMNVVSGNRFTGCSIGILLDSASTTITGNLITGNSIGIDWSGTSGAPTITDNAIYDNSYGVYNNFISYNLDVENNWWGDETGPYHATNNPSGLGDTVSGSVDFDPWLSTDPTIDEIAPAEVTLGTFGKDPWNKTITLNWTNPIDEDFDHVQIDRLATDGSIITLTTTEEGINYLDSTVEYDTYYTYIVYAVDTAGNVSTGVSSEAKQVRSPKVKHLKLRAQDGVIAVRWSSVPLVSTRGYKVYYGFSPDMLTSVLDVGPSRRRVLTGLLHGRTYYVAVAAYNRDGVEGPLSSVKSVEVL